MPVLPRWSSTSVTLVYCWFGIRRNKFRISSCASCSWADQRTSCLLAGKSTSAKYRVMLAGGWIAQWYAMRKFLLRYRKLGNPADFCRPLEQVPHPRCDEMRTATDRVTEQADRTGCGEALLPLWLVAAGIPSPSAVLTREQ